MANRWGLRFKFVRVDKFIGLRENEKNREGDY